MKPLSASELSMWRKDKTLYMKRYVEGEAEEPNEQMKLGTLVHKAIENPTYPWLKEMVSYPPETIKAVRKILDKEWKLRNGEPETVMRATTQNDIPLIAIFDCFNKAERTLDEYKITANKFRWNQYRVDVNFQLSFYAYVYYLNFHSYFTEMRLHQLNIATGSVKTFKTVRSKADVETMDRLVHYAVVEMKNAGVWEKRMTKDQRLKKNQLTMTV